MEEQMITADMAIGDVLNQHPNTIQVFIKHGLGCIGCAVAQFENIRQGARAHGIDLGILMKDLNETVLQAQAS